MKQPRRMISGERISRNLKSRPKMRPPRKENEGILGKRAEKRGLTDELSNMKGRLWSRVGRFYSAYGTIHGPHRWSGARPSTPTCKSGVKSVTATLELTHQFDAAAAAGREPFKIKDIREATLGR